MTCNNEDLGEGVDLFPHDLDGPIAIVLFADTANATLHIHQGDDCVVLAQQLAEDFADYIERAAGITYGHPEAE